MLPVFSVAGRLSAAYHVCRPCCLHGLSQPERLAAVYDPQPELRLVDAALGGALAFTTAVRRPFSRDGENRTRVVLVPNQVGGHCPTPR